MTELDLQDRERLEQLALKARALEQENVQLRKELARLKRVLAATERWADRRPVPEPASQADVQVPEVTDVRVAFEVSVNDRFARMEQGLRELGERLDRVQEALNRATVTAQRFERIGPPEAG